MKLRNKKTGEIIELLAKPSFVKRNDDYLQSEVNTFNSLAELNEEWEDYEEPEGWCITMYGGISRITKEDYNLIPDLKEIGNFFNDKESAYDGLAKLKAFKRLKDKGFTFKGINKTDGSIKTGLSKEVSFDDCEEFYSDMQLLFGDVS